MSKRLDSLKFITRMLAPDSPAGVEQLRAALVKEELSWESVIALANQNLVTPALWVGLSRKGLVALCPTDVQTYCSELYRLNRQRNLSLKRQTIEITAALNSVGVEPILLKGAVLLFSGALDIGLRVMTDIDLMVPVKKLESSVQVLNTIGYRASSETHFRVEHHHHWTPLWRPGDYAAVELHWALAREGAMHAGAKILPTELIWQQVEELDAGGKRALCLDPTYRMLHNIVHAEIADENHIRRTFALRGLHETALLCHHYPDDICWRTIRERLTSHGSARVFQSHLYAVDQLLGVATPCRIEPPALRTKVHSLGTLARVRWPWFARFAWRWHRISAHQLRKRYGRELAWSELARARLQHVVSVLTKHLRQAAAKSPASS